MELTLIESSVTPSPGFGAGSGEIIREEYKCPCGAGEVIYEKDDIPGFKESSIRCTCEDCREKYDLGRGIAKEKNNK